MDIRLKINLHDESVAEAAGRDVSLALATLLSAAGLAPEERMLQALARFDPFEAATGGARIALRAERADLRRFNLTVLLPRPFAWGSTDRFSPRPPSAPATAAGARVPPQP